MQELFFVYGTLRKGYGNHHLLEGTTFNGEAITEEKYAMYASGIPFVTEKEKEVHIKGEVYTVTLPEQIRKLDALEGHPIFYNRKKINVKLYDGTKTEAWLYFNDRPHGQKIKTGDYKDIVNKYY